MTRAARIAATLRLLRIATEYGRSYRVDQLLASVADGSVTPESATAELTRFCGIDGEKAKRLVDDLRTIVFAP